MTGKFQQIGFIRPAPCWLLWQLCNRFQSHLIIKVWIESEKLLSVVVVSTKIHQLYFDKFFTEKAQLKLWMKIEANVLSGSWVHSKLTRKCLQWLHHTNLKNSQLDFFISFRSWSLLFSTVVMNCNLQLSALIRTYDLLSLSLLLSP